MRNFLLIFFGIVLLFGSGCTSFQSYRTAQFVDMDARKIRVEYGEEVHEDVLPDGRRFSFKGKVRIALPDGKRIYLYQGMTETGNLYHNRDKDYHFLEKGPYCLLSHGGKVIFEGYYFRDQESQQ